MQTRTLLRQLTNRSMLGGFFNFSYQMINVYTIFFSKKSYIVLFYVLFCLRILYVPSELNSHLKLTKRLNFQPYILIHSAPTAVLTKEGIALDYFYFVWSIYSLKFALKSFIYFKFGSRIEADIDVWTWACIY